MKYRFKCFAMMLILASPFVSYSMEKDVLPFPLRIAQEYKVTNTSTQSIPSPIPGQNPTIQILVEVTRNDKKAYIFHWNGLPHRDLGPMDKKESWQVKFLGEDANVTLTSFFMGQMQEVFVLHHRLNEQMRLMIYSKDMNKEEFHEMLSKILMK